MTPDITLRRARALSVDMVDHRSGSTDPGWVTWVNGQIDAGIVLSPGAVEWIDFLAWKYRRQLPLTIRPLCNPRDMGRAVGSLYSAARGRVREEGSLVLDGELKREFEIRFERWARGGWHPSWNVSVNVDVLAIFGTTDEIAFEETLVRYAEFRNRYWWTNRHRSWIAGDLLGQAVQLGLVVQLENPRRWRLMDREMQWVLSGNGATRIRGLPPAEQAEMDRRRHRKEAARARRARTHAETIRVPITAALCEIVGIVPDAGIPAEWREFVSDNVAQRWPRLSDAIGLLSEQHLGWPIEDQVPWLRLVEATARRWRGWAEENESLSPSDELALAELI